MASSTDVARQQLQAVESVPAPADRASEPTPPELWYDRSSITVDAMVMIADQSPEDFERFAPETRICDYIDGVVYMPSPATDRHQDIIGFLFQLLGGFRWVRGGPQFGKVLLGPAVVRISEQRKLEPDLFIRPAPGAAPGEPPALMVVEVLSKSTRSHDLGLKLTVYRAAGIPEIWIVDDLSREPSVLVERKVGEGYRREMIEHGRIESSALPGFWIEADWLWSDPMPNPSECLRRILGEPENPR